MMSENEIPEIDIWDYKSLRKSKQLKTSEERTAQQHNREAAASSKREQKKTDRLKSRQADTTKDPRTAGKQNGHRLGTCTPTTKRSNKTQSPGTSFPRHSGHCPSCQMPFSILLVQTPRWHVSECLDTPALTDKECPDGITCSSTIPSHYKKFSHFQLAQSRAMDELNRSPLYSALHSSLETAKSPATHRSNRGLDNEIRPENCIPALDINNTPRSQRSPQSQSPASSQESVKQTSLDVWLSSPSKSVLSQGSLSPNSRTDPLYNRLNDVTAPNLPHQAPNYFDCEISYSPLHSDEELYSDDKDSITSSIKSALPCQSAEENLHRNKESLTGNQQLEDSHSNGETCNRSNSEPLFSESITHEPFPCAANQPETAPITEDDNWSIYSSPASCINDRDVHRPELNNWLTAEHDNRLIVSSSQMNKVILLGNIQSEQSGCDSLKDRTKQVSLLCIQPPLQHTPGLSQPAVKGEIGEIPVPQGSATMATVEIANAKAKKQMDIGVFFGLKPKPVIEKEAVFPLKSQSLNDVTAQGGNKRGPRKRKAQGSLGDTDSLNEIPNSLEMGSHKRQGKKFRQNSTGEGSGKKKCPFYKKIPGTNFTVDAFQYGQIEGCSAYFLTHFHSDHYGGLTKKFRFPIYCSKITGNLVQSKLRVEKEFINVLPMNTECVVDNIKVFLLDANHCPGAVLLLFVLPNGTTVLHTGDFRADQSMENYLPLIGQKIHTLYLDTTYCSPEYTFPPQHEVIEFAANAAFEMVTSHPRTLVVCGTYSVGKEKVFLAIAAVLGCKVSMSQDKYKTMLCLESEEISSIVTTDWHSTALHVLPMMQVNFKGLYAHLNKFSGKYERVLAFKPTGWTYSDQCSSVTNLRPETRGKVTLYGIPYSEHSSYLEMKRFVQWCKPQKIIPTVNVGSPKSRSTMEKYFTDWSLEASYKPIRKPT
ncbi:DNA cross-link repair 1A [Pelobates cultripes]|uniref:DNA cross-link repair 1A protein n=1 Tax=Pelobates cultripes TaxID=61616 RepID=A0AAD1TBH9_PELCU|nr:DNA cross-link repair 1A [Pelobates cultripes]CAH2323136.1 DNA cross-link repair 1A [Pelobates cultripes]